LGYKGFRRKAYWNVYDTIMKKTKKQEEEKDTELTAQEVIDEVAEDREKNLRYVHSKFCQ